MAETLPIFAVFYADTKAAKEFPFPESLLLSGAHFTCESADKVARVLRKRFGFACVVSESNLRNWNLGEES